MKFQAFSPCLLCYSKGPNAWGILFDPTNEWKNIQPFLQKNNIQLRYIFLTQPTFKNAFRIAQIKQETGAKFFSFKSDLLQLRNLPRLADEVNVCGIKVPHVDRFLDGLDQIDLDGNVLKIKSSEQSHHYQIGNQLIPPVKVETPCEME